MLDPESGSNHGLPMAVKLAVTLGVTVVFVNVQATEAPDATTPAVILKPVGKPPCIMFVLLMSVQLATEAPFPVVMLLAA